MWINKIRKSLIYIFIIMLPIDVALQDIIGSMSLINYVLLAYLGISVIDLIVNKTWKVRIKNMWNNKIVMAMVLMVIVSTIAMRIIDGRLDIFNNTIIFIVIMLLDEYKKSDRKMIENAILVSLIFVIISVIYTLASGHTFQGRVTVYLGKEYDPNYFAVGLNIILLTFFNKSMKEQKKAMYIVGTIIVGVIILLSGSRSALLASSVSIVMYLMMTLNIKNRKVFKSNNIKKIIVGIAIVGVVIGMCVTIFDILPQHILDRISIRGILEDGGSGRLSYWKSGYMYMRDNFNITNFLFGFGLNSYELATYYNIGIVGRAHNVYIQVLFEFGFLTFVSFGWLIYENLKKLINSKNTFMMSIFIGVLVASVTLDMIFTRYFWVVVFLSVINFNGNQSEKFKEVSDNENYNMR